MLTRVQNSRNAAWLGSRFFTATSLSPFVKDLLLLLVCGVYLAFSELYMLKSSGNRDYLLYGIV